MTRYILQILCPDQKGLIAGTTQVLAKAGANIIDLQQHTAKDIETFFLRAVFDIEADGIPEVKRHLQDRTRCHFCFQDRPLPLRLAPQAPRWRPSLRIQLHRG